jgi:alanine racemase
MPQLLRRAFSEAIRTRAVAPDATIYVLNGLFPGTCPAYAEFNFAPFSARMRNRWNGPRSARPGPEASEAAALHVDTAMNRLGLTARRGPESG